ncbi:MULTISPECIES: LytTR family transcriptional regulator DNA-binding domain-containing protein [Roseivirga]|uniref:DNA-binding response regulator n=1 Tax=Roseivirga thermotolerans TaxID=1758176 RepID=A0ABQ3I1G2_9BACT|nr:MULTISPECIES: LytTR family transcriptional regulator DNA-binding domain-containing protein [Roseivirga]MEC7755217.1 LytTR family transcriptional regulator DNA-binding domain-containing protein [Bacteroidota bacterium]GHE55436.1 DNA-binding response regulator [Roseivirga thermotolerans]|tara:strand:+ start:11933 stop:12673 length:741 start_codon:yes stop_codon:yes gene_type:complete
MKAIIIDDESLARELIKAYLKKFDQIEVIAECADGFEGLKAIQQHGPDLIFLDVQMPKITGFEMLELIDNPPVVIFSTAFDQYAIKAFELSAVDYLLKPYSESRFEEAVKKAIARVGQQSEQKQKLDKLQESRAEQDTLDRMVVKTGNKIQILSLKQIHHFEAQDDYVAIHSDQGKFLKLMRMKALENGLPTDDFVRIHRSHIVNVKHIEKLELYEKDSYILYLKNGQQLPVSRSGHSRLKEVLRY